MGTDLSFAEFVADQIDDSCDVSFRMMFGGCTFYLNGKVVALACDNRFLVKPTEAGRAFIGDVVEAPPYPGAKPAFLIEDKIEDGEWLTQLLILTEKELPKPKPKKKAKSKRS